MDKNEIIRRMRELKCTWNDIGYALDMSGDAARVSHKRQRDLDELGPKPVVKKSKFDAKVMIEMKKLAQDNSEMSMVDISNHLRRKFPDMATPTKSTVHRLLKESGFKMIKIKKKTISKKDL